MNGPVTWSNNKIHNNDISQTYTWDTTTNQYHHDGIMLENSAGGCCFVGTQIYFNYFHGLWSQTTTSPANTASHVTSQIFIDDSGDYFAPNTYMYRNILEFDAGDAANWSTNAPGPVGSCNVNGGCSPTDTGLWANNTLIFPNGGYVSNVDDGGNLSSDLNNLNLSTAGGQMNYPATTPYGFGGGSFSLLVDYNIYAGLNNVNSFCLPELPPHNSCGPTIFFLRGKAHHISWIRTEALRPLRQ